MTKDYKATEVAYKESHDLPPDYKLSPKNVPIDFPIEHARLRHIPWISAIFVVSTAGYGFSLSYPSTTTVPGFIALPLFLQFLVAAASNAVFAANQTLVSDLCPGKGASATAVNNLVRCGLGAVGVAGIEAMLASFGPAAVFFALALVIVIITPLTATVWCKGMEWRGERTRKVAEAEARKAKIMEP